MMYLYKISVCHKKHFEFDEDLQHIAQEEGIDVQTLKERVSTGRAVECYLRVSTGRGLLNTISV